MNPPLTAMDQAHLKRTLELAEGGRGRVSPNPLVGAVVVRDGDVVGEGFHVELGGLHAERAALADCRERGEDPAGATMYVTLEPCAHEGRQPPCVEAILEADIARVVIASDDPSEKTAGKGPAILRDGGVEVAFADGGEAEAARRLNQPFRKHAKTGLPLVTLKMAMSLDGQTATAPGDDPWISGPESRDLVHQWRSECDAIAVGIGTVLADDPLLTARIDGARQPTRVVFDSQARLPLDSQLLQTLDQAPVLVVTAHDAPGERRGALGRAGAETIAATDIESALRTLGRRGITSLLLEGGQTLASAFLASDQIDESRTFLAPMLLGRQPDAAPRAGGDDREDSPGRESPRSETGPARHPALESSTDHVGDDVLIKARYKEW
ncbi:MAG TPA: bifunctional diaminohydroxyphosphoribosylaminopyrimidine deaminase/5-amino-6-(5-phosphoribosylamino)uracil reductase RibD [Solirubrobacterales bacterium]|nr:bifunctional diaminohydroxyphosphoribosylaminopyrimidine deaminase/5-amino-6-(5-phosphoribosylamino)uracil reductase RibD [Solirubrobacterales bacterium]